jgi:general secretion pathway protein L
MHRIVGLDLSAEAVRLVALESGFRGFSVQQMAHAALPAEGSLAERLQQALPALSNGAPLSGDAIAVSMPGAQVASFPMTLPFTDPRRIEQVLPAEVEGAIPFDLDEVVWDYSVLSQEQGKSELLVAVVKKQALKDALEALGQAGVDPKVVTFAPLALAALGERKLLVPPVPDREGTEPGVDIAAVARGESSAAPPAEAILEAGPDRADFCVLRDGRAELARSLPSAGLAAWVAAAQDLQALQRVLAPLVRDLKLTLRAHGSKGGQAPRRLLLAGTLAQIDGATERMAAELSIPCEQLELGPGAQPEAGGGRPQAPAEHALALGLALRAQQPRGRLNFRKGEFAFTKDVSQLRGVILRLGAALAAVLLLALGLGIARIHSLSAQAKAYDDALCKATERILKKCHTDYREALAALRGGNSRAAGIPRVGSTEILAEVVQRLPADTLPALDDVEITTTRITLKGTAESYQSVDKIKAELQKNKCFGEIKQPRTEKVRDSQKVSFVFDFPYTCSGESGGGA